MYNSILTFHAGKGFTMSKSTEYAANIKLARKQIESLPTSVNGPNLLL
jgi:hypothetical protein